MKINKIIYLGLIPFTFLACDKMNEDRIDPLQPENFPIQIILSDEGDGDMEDNDKIGVKLELLKTVDPKRENLEGIDVFMPANTLVNFKIYDLNGASNLSDYIKGINAFYEIDDCQSSEDLGIDLNVQFDASTGLGSVIFPQGQNEIEIEIELDENLFDDQIQNTNDRGFKFKIESIASPAKVVANTDMEFEYLVLDDDVIFGSWELDLNNNTEWTAFKAFFSQLNEEIADLNPNDVNKIELEFSYSGIEIKIELVDTEEDECDPGQLVNKEIEIEADWDSDLEDLFENLDGEMEFEGSVEEDNGNEIPFKLVIAYEIINNQVKLILNGEFKDDLIEQTINPSK